MLLDRLLLSCKRCWIAISFQVKFAHFRLLLEIIAVFTHIAGNERLARLAWHHFALVHFLLAICVTSVCLIATVIELIQVWWRHPAAILAICLVFVVIFRILFIAILILLLLQINNWYFKWLGNRFLEFIFLLIEKTLLAIERLKLMLDSVYGFFALETL